MIKLRSAVCFAVVGWTALAAAALAAGLHRVTMIDVDYDIKRLEVHPGDRVEWVNADPVAHTATALDGSWEVDLAPGQSGSIAIQAPGTVPYLCRYHPNMQGEIVVSP